MDRKSSFAFLVSSILFASCSNPSNEASQGIADAELAKYTVVERANFQRVTSWPVPTKPPTPTPYPTPTKFPTPTPTPLTESNQPVAIIGSCQALKFTDPNLRNETPGHCSDYRLANGAASSTTAQLAGLATHLKNFCEVQDSGKWTAGALCSEQNTFGICTVPVQIRNVSLVTRSAFQLGGYFEKRNSQYEEVAQGCASPNSGGGIWRYVGDPTPATRVHPKDYLACPKFSVRGAMYSCNEYVGAKMVGLVRKDPKRHCLAELIHRCPKALAGPIVCEKDKNTYLEYRIYSYGQQQTPSMGELICSPLNATPIDKGKLD